uniref:HDC12415 n=1 Tax=Drosophila melanogaster TaxID=7227 RepID=Q6IKH7_DROME|nr:TPA_inf: HDC12415 [Drosophila melanogaster]
MQSIQYGFLAKQSMRIYELPAFCLFEPAIWPIVECPPEGSKMKLHGEKKLLQLDINFESFAPQRSHCLLFGHNDADGGASTLWGHRQVLLGNFSLGAYIRNGLQEPGAAVRLSLGNYPILWFAFKLSTAGCQFTKGPATKEHTFVLQKGYWIR